MDTDERLAKLKQRFERRLITKEVYDQKQLQILDEEDNRGNNNNKDFVTRALWT